MKEQQQAAVTQAIHRLEEAMGFLNACCEAEPNAQIKTWAYFVFDLIARMTDELESAGAAISIEVQP